MSYRAKQLREEIAAAIEQGEALAMRESLSPEARTKLDTLPGEIERMQAELSEIERKENHTMNMILARTPSGALSVADLNRLDPDAYVPQTLLPDDSPLPRGHNSGPTPQWSTLDGRPVNVLARAESFAKKFNAKPAVSLGDMIRCAITGRGTSTVKAALGEDQNASGGFLVPIETGRQLIDLARAKSVLVQAGAATVEMESDRLTIARVKTDPTMEVKEENQAFTATDFTFEAVGFTAHTIGCLIYASRELAADAPNFSVQVESVITAALGAELDRLGLVGSGSQEPLGIANYPRVGTTGSIGAIAWEDVHTAATGVRAANGEPNAWVAHPTIAGDLEILTSGDGTNSAKLWLGPPPGVAELAKFTTTNVTTANLIVGDFTKMLIGLRQRPMVEFSPVAGDAFAKHQIAIKVTWRGDFGLSQPTHFHVLSGITT